MWQANLGNEEDCTSSLSIGRSHVIALVVECYVTEQVGHRLLVMDPTDGFRQEDGDVYSFNFFRCHLGHFVVMRDRVCHNHLQRSHVQFSHMIDKTILICSAL